MQKTLQFQLGEEDLKLSKAIDAREPNSGTIRRLWSDGSVESREAETLLKERKLQFVEIGYTPTRESEKGPVLVTAAGVFSGKKKIEEYCEYWVRMERR